MKRFIQLLTSLLIFSGGLHMEAQEVIKLTGMSPDTVPVSGLRPSGYCGDTPYPVHTDRMNIPPGHNRQRMALPEVLRVFIHVVKNDDGSGMETSMDSVMLKFEYMKEVFAPHGVCFLLAGIDEIYNTDLDTQYYDVEESELSPYIKSGMLNIFIHNYLASSPGGNTSGGWAYEVPNPYFSWWEASVADSNALSVVAHETGHCFGLYHTHENNVGNGAEKVDRVGGCTNCLTNGDLLCDTPADPDLSINGLMSGCTYIGAAVDGCNDLYTPDPTNIMAYSPGICQTNFTPGQGSRVLDQIYNVQFLTDMIVPLNIVFPFNLSFLFDSEEWFWMAEGYIHMESPSLVCSQTAEVTFVAGDEVTIGPGTTFAPSTGFVLVSAQSACQ